MSYVIGFDLGTHQTKICVQDATNPSEKTYQFFEFDMPDGSRTVLFPSIVQVNKDHTVSYGYSNEDDCLILGGNCGDKPKLELEEEPEMPVLPKYVAPKSYPSKPKFDPWLDNLKKLKGQKTDLDLWEEKCAAIDASNKKNWEAECAKIEKAYQKRFTEIRQKNEVARKKFEKDLELWEKASKPQKFIFRYFKLHALTGVGAWNCHEISSEDVCVWYITYILLKLRECYGEDISIQFGVPCGASGNQRDKAITKRAYRVYIAAQDLAEKFNNLEDFLATPYEKLLELTDYKWIDDNTINDYAFDDLPEAFAGLVAVTLQKKLDKGFHLLVDIGGGTTDMALFCINHENWKPDVIYVTSFAKGINHILEETSSVCKLPMEMLQETFLTNPSQHNFKNPIRSYQSILRHEGEDVSNKIKKSFTGSYHHHGRKLSELEMALKNQPVIFGGGGGAFKELQVPLQTFTDIRRINKGMLGIRNLLTMGIDEKTFTILATSYGLASYEKDYGETLKCTDISVAFETFLPRKDNGNSIYDRYEHGLSDI